MARVCSASVAFAVLFLAGSLNVVVGSREAVTTEEASLAASSGSPRVVTAVVGSSVHFCCNVSTTSSDNVVLRREQEDMIIWTLDDYINTRERRFRHRPKFPCDGRMVLIDSVKIVDSGDYVCFESGKPTNRQVIHLSVIEPRTKIVGEPIRYVVEGASVNLTCVIEPSPASEVIIQWTRDTGEVTNASFDRFGCVGKKSRRGRKKVTNASFDRFGCVGKKSRKGRKKEIVHFHNNEHIATFLERGYSLMITLLINNISLSEAGNYTCAPSEGNNATITVHVTHGQFGAGIDEAELSTSNVVFSEVESSSAPEITTAVSRTSDENRKLDEFETEETRGLTLTEVQRLVMLRKLNVLALQEDVSKLQIQVLRLEKEKLLQTENRRIIKLV